MEFLLEDAILILERTPRVLRQLLNNLPEKWLYQNEGGTTWSVYDVIGHYIHGEKTDWIPRMQIILNEAPDKNFVPFDRFAQFRDSKGKSFDELMNEFTQLRAENIKILKAIKPGKNDLEKKGTHPEFGEVSLSELLAAWVVHDLTHINQISRVMAKQYEQAVGPWKAYMGILNR